MRERNHETLRATGEALFGPNWQTPLADSLGVKLRTMQRWAAGTNAMPETIWPEIAKLCRSRGQALEKIAAEIERSR